MATEYRRVEGAHQMVALGREIASWLRAGDLVVLVGDLGAGKTTFAQGLGAGLGVRGPITSPTFVVARRHPSLVDGCDLIHVDAYRVTSAAEIDDLDLGDDDAITVVEWGSGLVEHLADSYLRLTLSHVELGNDPNAPSDLREVTIEAVGPRWRSVGSST